MDPSPPFPPAKPSAGLATASERRREEKAEQDRLLDQLHASVLGMRDNAKAIGGELHLHDGVLNRLGTSLERTNVEAENQTRSVMAVLQQSKHRGFIGVVIVLVLIIVLLLFL